MGFETLKQTLVRRASSVKQRAARAVAAIQRARRKKRQIQYKVSESWASLRLVWTDEKPQPASLSAIATTYTGQDFMESLLQRALDPQTHALVRLRTCARLGCDSITESRSGACALHGWSAELIEAARDGVGAAAFSERDRLLLRYADDITRTPTDVDPQVLRQLRTHFTQDQIVEITASICYENFRTRFHNAVGQPCPPKSCLIPAANVRQ